MKHNKGFTLIEILVVIGIIAILAAVVLIAINPARQFKQARDSQRTSNVNAILNAVGQRMADNKGVFETGCAAGVIPTTATEMSEAGYDIRPCIVPTYMSEIPVDPTSGSNSCIDVACLAETYNTGYTIKKGSDIEGGRITVVATGEITNPISVTR